MDGFIGMMKNPFNIPF